MRRRFGKLAKLGAGGLLLLLGGTISCTAQPAYGVPDAGSVPDCVDETPCRKLGTGWYCDHTVGRCEWDDRTDAGASVDAGE